MGILVQESICESSLFVTLLFDINIRKYRYNIKMVTEIVVAYSKKCLLVQCMY